MGILMTATCHNVKYICINDHAIAFYSIYCSIVNKKMFLQFLCKVKKKNARCKGKLKITRNAVSENFIKVGLL